MKKGQQVINKEKYESKDFKILKLKRMAKLPLSENIGEEDERIKVRNLRYAKNSTKLNEQEKTILENFMKSEGVTNKKQLLDRYSKEKTFAPMKKILTNNEVQFTFRVEGDIITHLSNNHLFLKMKFLNSIGVDISNENLNSLKFFLSALSVDKAEFVMKIEKDVFVTQTSLYDPISDTYFSSKPDNLTGGQRFGNFSDAGNDYSLWLLSDSGVDLLTNQEEFLIDMGVGPNDNIPNKELINEICIIPANVDTIPNIKKASQVMEEVFRNKLENKWGYSNTGSIIMDAQNGDNYTYLKFKSTGFIQTEYWISKATAADVIYTCSMPIGVFIQLLRTGDNLLAALGPVAANFLNENTITYFKAGLQMINTKMDFSIYTNEIRTIKQIKSIIKEIVRSLTLLKKNILPRDLLGLRKNMIIIKQILLIYPQLDFQGLGTMLELTLKLIAGGMVIQCKALVSNDFVKSLNDICFKIIGGDIGSVNAINLFLENACKVFNIQRFKQLFYMSAESMSDLRSEIINKLKANARNRIEKNGIIFKNWSNIVNQVRIEEVKKQEININRNVPAIQSENQVIALQLQGINENLSTSSIWVYGNNLLTVQTPFKDFYENMNKWYVSDQNKDLNSFRTIYGSKLIANKELNKELMDQYEEIYVGAMQSERWLVSNDIFFFYNFRALWGMKKKAIGEPIANSDPISIPNMRQAIEDRVEIVVNYNNIINNEDIPVERAPEEMKEVEIMTETNMSTGDINSESKKLTTLTDTLVQNITYKSMMERLNKYQNQNLQTIDDLIKYVKALSDIDNETRATIAVAQMKYSKNTKTLIHNLKKLIETS
jgi:hypothetical protein